MILQHFGDTRRTLDAIKACHGEDRTMHVFPALPVSAAVELGRVLMPKADVPCLVYDRNHNPLAARGKSRAH